jgi:hypothetical protein
MINPGDTYIITKNNDYIEEFIKQTDGLRLSEQQSKKLIEFLQQDKELHDCLDCEGCICEDYCKEQDKLDFPKDYIKEVNQ